VIPALAETYVSFHDIPDEDDINLFIWMNNNIEQATVMVPLGQANAFSYYSGKKNILDSNFLLIPDVEERIVDLDESYQTPFKNNAIRNLNKYNC